MIADLLLSVSSEPPAASPSRLHDWIYARLAEPWRTRLQTEVMGNSLLDHAAAALVFCGIWALIWVFKRVVLHRLALLTKKTEGDFDDFLIGEVAKIRGWFFAVVSLYVSARYLTLPAKADHLLWILLVVALTVRGVLFLQALVAYAVEKSYFRQHARDPASVAAIGNVVRIIRWLLWAGAGVFVLDNLGFNITTAVAGLGIGGIAIAISAQAILGDLFSSFSIYIDKPFRIGDLIAVGDLTGTVENIGLKTTRVRSFSGEQLVFSNADLTASRIRNFKQMQERRVLFRLGVTYQTTLEQTRKIPDIVRGVIAAVPGTRMDRAHFSSFGDFALIYEIVYYVLSPDVNVYMDVQQQINLALKERFEAEKIEFAYPTQTLFVARPDQAGS